MHKNFVIGLVIVGLIGLTSSLERGEASDGEVYIDAALATPSTREIHSEYFENVDALLINGFEVMIEGRVYKFPVELSDFIISEDKEALSVDFTEKFMVNILISLEKFENIKSHDLVIIEANPTETDYVETAGDIGDGAKLSTDLTQTLVEASLASGSPYANVTVALQPLYGKIVDESGNNLGPFDHLGTGRSYFALSTPGRDYNIRKALNDHFDNILVPAGAEFSFNKFLGEMGGINGWKMAYIIWKGELVSQPGGGICQVSTTMYRAALDAGFEIVDQRSHTLYVTYYEEYGNGLDATIYPGEQNLVFKNNTDSPILIRAYDDGLDAFVEMYGKDDGRKISYEGPYTNSNQTDAVMEELGTPLKYYQIAWKYTIDWPDGTGDEKWLISSYKSRVKQYGDEDVMHQSPATMEHGL